MAAATLAMVDAVAAVPSRIPSAWAETPARLDSVCPARFFTSSATTAKPFPASPARAASIVAFSASSLVWLAMLRIRTTTSLIRSADCGQRLDRGRRLARPHGRVSGDFRRLDRAAADRVAQV